MLVVLSSRAEAFSPLLPWEAALRDAALARGYQHARTYRFNDGYFLWVLERAVRPECALPRAAAAGG